MKEDLQTLGILLSRGTDWSRDSFYLTLKRVFFNALVSVDVVEV